MLHPVVGFHGRSWIDNLLSSTADVAIAGFLLKEDDSTNGDPFLASKFKQRPKTGGSVTECVREILGMVCDVLRGQVGIFRISSFRKFMPTIAKFSNSRGLPSRQTSLGRLVVSLKRTDLFLKAELPASSQLARLCFQTNTHQKLALQICENMCVLIRKTREAILARGGINHLPITDGWDTLFLNTTVSSLSSDGIDSDNSSSDSYTE